MDGSSLAKKLQVSCLKFEPKVSNFPVIKATLGFYNQYYYEKYYLYERTLKRMSDCFSRKKLKQSFYFLFYNA